VVSASSLTSTPPLFTQLHGFVGAVLAFVLVFRSNGAYDRYYEGRKLLGTVTNQLRELILETYSVVPKVETDDHPRYREQIRRKVNILMAFIRCVCGRGMPWWDASGSVGAMVRGG
jgi:predicted membrane chloride channel (bestrophin family)